MYLFIGLKLDLLDVNYLRVSSFVSLLLQNCCFTFYENGVYIIASMKEFQLLLILSKYTVIHVVA